ncbi:hypothetical protein PR202_ga02653 [Eleusine coracana subsp. coracana]|uniref:Peptidase M48 domain-containing protein n=1 Tax=Eleusine coracana subsp. coracana TaxID=191504 RepID=A0AAV5BMA7_ELECO|nr:hypothetical protein PR202_ga02653 [Eleusine coracana subsp. coracana]
MNCLRNSRSLLSSLLRRRPAVLTPPPLRPRGYHTFRVPRDRPAQPWPHQSTPLQAPARRYQHTGSKRKEVTHWWSSSRRHHGSGGSRRWYKDEGVQAGAVGLVVTGGAVFCCRREAVPYTDRTRLILLSPSAERKLGEWVYEREKKKLGSKILSPLDPESIRVRRIADEIVAAVYRGLASRQDLDDADDGGNNTASVATVAQRDDQDLTMRKSRGKKPPQVNLDGMDWEVIVVKNNMINAMCAPGGKIIVFTGLLDKFKEDAEVATVLGHEFFNMPEEILDAASKYLLELPFSRRMEMEADHVGFMLLATAGYDPRVAPSVYERLGKIGRGESKLHNYISTHPSSEKRSQLLSQEHVMSQALELYSKYWEGISQGSESLVPRSGTQVNYGKEISGTSAT